MKNINLNTVEKIGVWIWRMLMVVIVSWILYNQQTFSNEVRGGYIYLKPLIENTAEMVSTNKDQPGIPDVNNNEYQASCPVVPDYYDDPAKVARFIEIVGPYGQQYPWMIDYLISSNILQSDQIRKMLQDEYSHIQN